MLPAIPFVAFDTMSDRVRNFAGQERTRLFERGRRLTVTVAR